MKHCLIFFCLLAVGCSERPGSLPPLSATAGRECSRCLRPLQDARFSAARRLGTRVRVFHDVGELFEERLESPPVEEEQLWVADYAGSKWLDARQAHYVESVKVLTPMGYGIVALPSKEQAVLLHAQEGGQVLDFDAVQGRFVRGE